MIEEIAGFGDILSGRRERLVRRPDRADIGGGEPEAIFLAERREHSRNKLRLLFALFAIHRGRSVAEQH